jgi:hypothetical protein
MNLKIDAGEKHSFAVAKASLESVFRRVSHSPFVYFLDEGHRINQSINHGADGSFLFLSYHSIIKQHIAQSL